MDALDGEDFRDIEGFDGYQVSNMGRVRSRRVNGKNPRGEWIILNPTPDRRGYPRACLFRNGRKIFRRVHRLVLETFVGPRPDGMDGCHDPDPDPANNRLSNIRWDTHESNMKDSIRHGRRPRGERASCVKLNDSKVQLIRFLMNYHDGCQTTLGRIFGAHGSRINRIFHRKSWAHVPDVDRDQAPPLKDWFDSLGMALPESFRTHRGRPRTLGLHQTATA